VPHGLGLSEDFTTNKFGLRWSFYKGDADEMTRVRTVGKSLELPAKGDSPANTSPLAFLVDDPAYQFFHCPFPHSHFVVGGQMNGCLRSFAVEIGSQLQLKRDFRECKTYG
jgi:hypothetical protein